METRVNNKGVLLTLDGHLRGLKLLYIVGRSLLTILMIYIHNRLLILNQIFIFNFQGRTLGHY